MAHLIVLVLNNLSEGQAVLSAWDEAGASGVTIFESTGLQRLRTVLSDDVPLFPSLRDLEGGQELHHRTFITVVRDDEVLQRVLKATSRVIGDLNAPHSGLLFVLPVSHVWGLDRHD